MLALDLFCGAGGAAVGMHRTGLFDTILGVDILPQQDYPFDFIQSDAIAFEIADLAPDFIWASPPCQRYSSLVFWNQDRDREDFENRLPHLIPPTREKIAYHPWTCIENVNTAPLRPDIILEGGNVGIKGMARRRIFEVSWNTLSPKPFTDGEAKYKFYGHGSITRPKVEDYWRHEGRVPRWCVEDAKELGIDWTEDRDAIPQMVWPEYAQYIIEDAVRHGFGMYNQRPGDTARHR